VSTSARLRQSSFRPVPIAVGVLLLVVSFVDLAPAEAARYFSFAIVAFSVVLLWFAFWRLASWTRVITILLGSIAAIASILQIISLWRT
jgi:hypothetical protein